MLSTLSTAIASGAAVIQDYIFKTVKAAIAVTGSIGFPSKMPGTSYGIPATACKVGAKLARIAGSVCSKCYALKANYTYPSVQIAQARRLAGIANPAWPYAMAFLLLRYHGQDARGKVHRKLKAGGAGWHRWHDAGDLQSRAHLAAICHVARLTPGIRHWLPTREAALVAGFLRDGGTFPPNLTVRVSATMVDGAPSRAFPNTSTVHAAIAPQGHACPAPQQGNECGPCRACWDRNVSNVSYHEH